MTLYLGFLHYFIYFIIVILGNIDKQNTVIGNNFYMKIRPLLEKHKYVIGKQEYIDDSIIKKKGFSKNTFY